MVFTRTQLLPVISDGLALIKSSCELRGWLHLFDNNVAAQHFFRRFLNAAFDLNLVEMDQIHANFPAIDLGDESSRIAIQVTAERRSNKVQQTLDKFVEHGLDKKYGALWILIIGERQSTYKPLVVPTQLRFDPDRDIIGIEELTKQIAAFDTERLEKLHNILAEELCMHIDAGRHARNDFHLVGVPYAPELFVGREEDLSELKRRLGALDPPRDAQRLQVLSAMRGWPGVGKTSLATVVAHDADVRAAFPDGVLWTSLGLKPNLLSELTSWGRALGARSILHATTIRQAVLEVSALLREKRVLVVVDDVWSIDHTAPFRQLTPQTGALLFTTRLPEVAGQIVPTDAVYNLPVLDERHALELLRRIAPAIVENHLGESQQLVNNLECLPLAIIVAGRLLAAEMQNNWGVMDLLAELHEGSAKLLQANAPSDCVDSSFESLSTVAALLQKSTDRLTEASRELFASLGAFAPRPATFDLKAIQAVWAVSDPRPGVRILVDRGLLEPCRDGRFQMHSLLVAHAKSLCTG